MKHYVSAVKQRIAKLNREINEMQNAVEGKLDLLNKYVELLNLEGEEGQPVARPGRRRGRKPGRPRGRRPGRPAKKRGPGRPRGRKPGRPPGRKPGRPPLRRGRPKGIPGPGRRPAGSKDTLPARIIEILGKAAQPMKAKQIYEKLKAQGWKSAAAGPEALVYKTLFRIEKLGKIKKVDRGTFTTK